MKCFKKLSCVALALVMVLSILSCGQVNAAKIKLNRIAVTISPDNTASVYVLGTNKTVKWSSSNKKVALVKNGTIKGISEGKCKVYAKVSGKKLTCKVTVRYTTNEKLSNMNNWVITLWNDGYCDLYHYAYDGTDACGDKMNVDKTIEKMKKLYAETDYYDSFLNGLKGSEYDDSKKAWKELKAESANLYNKALSIDWHTIKFESEYDLDAEPEKIFDTELFVELRDALTDALEKVTF